MRWREGGVKKLHSLPPPVSSLTASVASQTEADSITPNQEGQLGPNGREKDHFCQAILRT